MLVESLYEKREKMDYLNLGYVDGFPFPFYFPNGYSPCSVSEEYIPTELEIETKKENIRGMRDQN